MNNHKVELLAPAGNYESFIGAINAGADAVYVGGEKFSARAYADNFDTETLCNCIEYAHLFGRRVYLTLNTLIKENEFDEIYDYVLPFYLAGLDGVIIQDFGILKFIKEHFPGMELHASTQMAVTGSDFVNLCKELGISRVVPARELSLKELEQIKNAGIEVECFIHGAMCYCYSGMCLMSSILGGRSGNRGKCAQPCRLAYQVNTNGSIRKERYTLSLKDMCTLEHIPELIKAGMDSFKIEGRMKRSEYAAGVTALYRKYIDKYYNNPEEDFIVSKADKKMLEHLYIRSELHDGYLFKHNGREMVTGTAPNYNALDENVLENIRNQYIGYTQKLPVFLKGYFKSGQVCKLIATTKDGISVTVDGFVVDKAQKTASNKDSVIKQLTKFGNTNFVLQEIEIDLSEDCFLPNGALNALRRDVLAALEKKIINVNFPDIYNRKANNKKVCVASEEYTEDTGLSVLVSNEIQLNALLKHDILKYVKNIYFEEEALACLKRQKEILADNMNLIFTMPYIVRNKDKAKLTKVLDEIFDLNIKHILVRNIESVAFVCNINNSTQKAFKIITDASLYCWNKQAKAALLTYAERVTLPFELNSKEVKSLRGMDTEQIVYGYIPLMHSANCIFMTNDKCMKAAGSTNHVARLKDRYGKVFTVLTNCKYCYNTIYNSVPLSLHKKYNKSIPGNFRIQFSIENERQVADVLDYYINWMEDNEVEFPIKDYTTAHENRQVE